MTRSAEAVAREPSLPDFPVSLAGATTAESKTVAKLDWSSGPVGYRASARSQDTEVLRYDRGRPRVLAIIPDCAVDPSGSARDRLVGKADL